MLCEEAESLFDAYLADALRDDVLSGVEHHLAGCSHCAAKLKEAEELLRETGSVLKWALPEAGFEDRVRERVAGSTIMAEKTWGDVMREQWERAPWWMISAAFHAVILMLMTIITVATAEKKTDDVVITTDLAKKKEPEYDENKVRDIFKNTKEVEADEIVENPVFVHEEVEVTDHFETENEMETNTARGQEDAISDIPLGGTGVVGNIGVGGGGAGCFGYRTGGGRKAAVGKFGGSRGSESAVDAALRWLARHQEPAGDWEVLKYNTHQRARDYRTGPAGLALLAFLGAGHTERAGKFKTNVRATVGWLMEQQKANGLVYRDGDKDGRGFDHGTGYHHAIGALALAEAYGMARNPKVGEAAQKAVDYTVNVHQHEYGGWRYHKRSSEDTSVTGWFIMQLKSAKVAGLKVEGKGFSGASAFLDKVTTKPGDVAGDEYGGRGRYTEAAEPMPTMTAVCMLGRQFMGWKHNDPILIGGGEYLLDNLPVWGPSNGHSVKGTNFYYWYYGTLSMFQMGGKYWKAWNGSLRDMLIKNQRKGGDEDGSWDPPETSAGSVAGRVYSTALGALCLEVYYRYLPMYKK